MTLIVVTPPSDFSTNFISPVMLVNPPNPVGLIIVFIIVEGFYKYSSVLEIVSFRENNKAEISTSTLKKTQKFY